ncbi:MAG: SDR family NAD(P)-dependent oxidoreductase [bacterium]|nr:SDR family NAD(P)-dependent oxidoreductase [bacterium]
MNVLITGTDKGIGKALAEKFLAEGHFVFGAYLSEAFPASDASASHQLDLSSPESIAECAKKISESGKKIDILINNAGILLDEDETRVLVDKLRETLEVNLIGTIDFTERVIPMIPKGGHIVNISSTAGSLEFAGTGKSHHPYHYPSYKISKAALNMYTRTLATALKDSEIIVSSVHPGWTKTAMGGQEADITSEEAAAGIYKFAISKPETGLFWFKGERLPW